ncbi:MAG: outer membrane protein assembly factor BamA [Pseudomonadota bacterium]
MKKSLMFQKLAVAFLLGAVLFFASAAFAADVIREIRVEGNQRIEAATVLSYIDLQNGDPFDQALLDRALKSLYATGLFADVSIRQQGQALVVTVTENPIINEIRFEGNKKIKSEDLQAELQLKPRQVLTRARVLADAERVQEIYRVTGRFSAVVDPKIIRMDQNRVNLIFEISEGPETLISRISFIGNRRYSDGQLQKVIRSREDRWYRFWTSDDKYDPDRLAYDQELLRKFYLEHGYADFRVDTAIAELSPDRKDFLVTFSVEEGNRYKIGKVDVRSKIPELNAARVKDTVAFKPGDWYRAGEIEDTITRMTNELGNLQFAFVDVQPAVTRNRPARTVDIVFTVNDGQKTFIENINISGNTRTLDEVIRREMKLVEGDPFNASRIRKSEQQIRDLGFFEKAEVRPRPGSSPDRTNIDVRVDEKSTGELSVGAGYSTTDGPLADFRIKERNFLGKGQELQLSSMLASKKSEFNFSFTEPYFLKRDLSAGIDLFHVTQDLQDQSSYNSRRSGGGLRLGYPLSERWRQNLNYRYERNEITDVLATASLYIQQQEGKRDTSAVAQTLIYDTRDSRLAPTEGFIGRINTEVAGLGGEARYAKARVGGTYYYPVVDKWVLSLLGEVGYIHGWGGETVRINERFYMGGDTLRGFADSGIGPRDSGSDDALGGNRFWRGSVELDFPTGLPEDLGLRAHVFSDVGDLWTLDDSGGGIQDVSSVRMAAGGGISWRSPLGPVRIDLSRPVLRESFDKVQQFRFSFGTRF